METRRKLNALELAAENSAIGSNATYHRVFEATPRRSREVLHRLVALNFVSEMVLIVAALCLTFQIRFHTPIREIGIRDTPAMSDYAGYFLLASGLLSGMLIYAGLYDARSLLRLRTHISRIIRWSFVWMAAVLSVSFMFRFEPPLSRVFCLMASVTVPLTLILVRVIFHHFATRSEIIGAVRQRVVFVGWNEATARLAQHFASDSASAYRTIGYIDTDGTVASPFMPCLGTVDDLERILPSTSADIVLASELGCDRNEILRLINTCEREMIDFKLVPSHFQILLSGLSLETVAGLPVMGLNRLPLDQIISRLFKRSIDILGSILGLVISFPVILVFGTIVYLESPGPIFYRQRRLGRHGRIFDILKIRSMRLDAESAGRAGWTVANDPRRLKIGAFMRRWNIDEVPQFWNVLVGDMSLVGPRPERPELIATFKHDIPHYNARHSAKPGITGWAQINGLRGNTDLTERIRCDLWYMENWSTILDFQIMFLTFFKRRNAG